MVVLDDLKEAAAVWLKDPEGRPVYQILMDEFGVPAEEARSKRILMQISRICKKMKKPSRDPLPTICMNQDTILENAINLNTNVFSNPGASAEIKWKNGNMSFSFAWNSGSGSTGHGLAGLYQPEPDNRTSTDTSEAVSPRIVMTRCHERIGRKGSVGGGIKHSCNSN